MMEALLLVAAAYLLINFALLVLVIIRLFRTR